MISDSEERDRIHRQLMEYVTFDEGLRLRNRLRELAKILYVPKSSTWSS